MKDIKHKHWWMNITINHLHKKYATKFLLKKSKENSYHLNPDYNYNPNGKIINCSKRTEMDLFWITVKHGSKKK